MFDGSATFHRLKRWPLGVLLLALLFPRAAQPSENDQIASGFPVVLDSRTVTVIYAPDRAKGIAQRLEEFAENRSLPLDLIQIEELPGHGTIIFARNTILMGVTDADAADAHLSKPALATQIVASMRDAVSQYRRDWSAKNVIKYILYALAATAVLLVLLYGLASLYRIGRRRILAWTKSLRLKRR